MDEIDGCGSGDRGGIQALIAIIKQSKVPIICICNDRQNRKLQTLITYCFDLKFMKPNIRDIQKRISAIAKNEGLSVSDQQLETLIASTGGSDLRQIINILQMWKRFDNPLDISKDESVMINNFDAANKLLNHGEVSLHKNYPTFRQKMDLFFIDYDFIPLLVQESYLNSFSERESMQDVEDMATAAEMISFGD